MLNQPIPVVHLVTTLNTGGLEQLVLDLVRRCDRSKISPHVICLEVAGDLDAAFRAAGVVPKPLHMDGMSLPSRVWRLAGELRALRPHVLHTHNTGPHLLGMLAGKIARVSIHVHTKHGRNLGNQAKVALINRVASRFTDRVVGVSYDATDLARTVEKVDERRLAVIHNGIDLSKHSGRDEETLSDRVPGRAIHVARLNAVKDQPTLLRATRGVVDCHPEFCLDIVGDGPARQELESLTKQLHLENNVRFLGLRQDIPELLAQADFFVLSSISEGIALTLLEAMAASLPIVATDAGGNREIVEGERTGILVPVGNPEALAAGMIRLAGDAQLRKSMGAAGRRRVVEKFDINRVVAEYEALYLNLLGDPRRGATKVAGAG